MKPSDHKPYFAAELRRVRDLLVVAASLGSTADAALVRTAVESCRFASQWVKSTTVTDQSHAARRARALEDAAYATPSKTNVTNALACYGRALDLFTQCRYEAAQVNVQNAERLLLTI